VTARRVLLTGASGLLGTWLRRAAPADVGVVGVVRTSPLDGSSCAVVDLRDPGPVVDVVRRVRPDVVVHAAYARDAASIVAATRNVALAAATVDAELVFISTDAVFSGDGVARRETDGPDPVWDYGRWKAEAEGLALDAVGDAAVVRLPLLVSIDPDDPAVARLRAGAATGERVVWFDDELRQPANAREVAAGVWRLLSVPRGDRAGCWHLPGPELLSRYEIARRLAPIVGIDPREIPSSPLPADAVRPRHLRLLADRAERAIDWRPRPIPEA
jgi:dTDP-4-dehydrorhamnose reductase